MDSIADTILNLIAVYGKDAVTAAAVRTLPVITFAESNKAIGKYKDEVCDARKELVSLNRLITNLEGEVKRQVKELKEKDRHAFMGTGHIGMEKMEAIARHCHASGLPMVIE